MLQVSFANGNIRKKFQVGCCAQRVAPRVREPCRPTLSRCLASASQVMREACTRMVQRLHQLSEEAAELPITVDVDSVALRVTLDVIGLVSA